MLAAARCFAWPCPTADVQPASAVHLGKGKGRSQQRIQHKHTTTLLWSLTLPTHTQLVPCASPMDDSTGLSERSTLAMHRSVARWLLRILCSDVFKACTLTDSKSAKSAKPACAIVAHDKPAPGSVVWVCSAWDAMVCDVYAKFKRCFAAKTTKLNKLPATTKCCIATLGVLTRCALSLCQCGAPSRCLCSPGACRSAGHQCPRSSSRAGCVPRLQSSSMHACTWHKTSAELGERAAGLAQRGCFALLLTLLGFCACLQGSLCSLGLC